MSDEGRTNWKPEPSRKLEIRENTKMNDDEIMKSWLLASIVPFRRFFCFITTKTMKALPLLLNSLLALDRRSAIATGSTGLSSAIASLSVAQTKDTDTMNTAGHYLQSLLGLESRVAVVTGSTGGLGRAIVETLAKSGCMVVVNGRNEDKTAKAAKEIIETCNVEPSKVLAAHGDTSDPKQAQNIIRKVERTFGGMDILVNNAGINLPEGSFANQYSPENWEKIQKVNIVAL